MNFHLGGTTIRHLALAPLCLLLFGCVTPIDSDRGIPPFYIERAEALPNGQVKESTHLWPLYSLSTTPPDRREIRVLWPLFIDRVDGENRKTWLLPFFHRSSYTHLDGRVDVDGFALPLFLWGSDPAEGDYFAFTLLGGTLKGLIGKDRIDFVLFPLWARMKDRQQITTYWLFPFVEFDEGPLRRGFRIFPFYSHSRGFTSRGELRDESKYVMWPFWHQSHTQLDTDNPSHAWWIWPFYGQIESKKRIARTVLYPLWTEEHDFRSETSVWSLFPWSVGTHKGEWNMFQFPPLFGVHERPQLRSGYFLWPIWQWEYQHTARRKRTVRRLLPFWRKIIDEDLDQDTTRTQQLLWPLVRWQTDATGVTTATAPALLPFDGPEGFNWSHGRAGQIFRWREKPDSWGLELFWGMVTAEGGPAGGEFSILGGLLSKERVAGQDDTRWRLLYIPF